MDEKGMNHIIFSKQDDYKKNLLQVVSDKLDEEVGKYIKNILLDRNFNNEFKDLDTAALRGKIFRENKEELLKEINIDVYNELQDLKEKYNELCSRESFDLTKRQSEKIKEWDKSHDCAFKVKNGSKYSGAIGGHLTYIFTPTGIGTFVTIKCSCGAKLELDDNF